jgi:hypothetical protein
MPLTKTGLGLYGGPITEEPPIGSKAQAGLPPLGFRIPEFDTWRPGYAGAAVEVMQAGTTLLAPLFSDPFLTTPIANPQTLLSMTDVNGQTYGKWFAPVYTYLPCVLFINQTDGTGVEQPPLVTLAGIDASLANVMSARGGYPVVLQAFLDRDVDATLMGPLGTTAGAAQNNLTLQAAIGFAAAQGGGDVLLPPISIPFLNLTLPTGVVLRGKGKSATTLFSTQTVTPVITIGGDGAGLAGLTLDGLDLPPQSIGVQGIGRISPVFEDVLIQRFETGIRFRGVRQFIWHGLTVSNCAFGANLRGDVDNHVSNAGTETSDGLWEGGEVALCTISGLSTEFFDAPVRDITIRNVLFAANTGDAWINLGGRGISLVDCQWVSNITDIAISDGTNLAFVALNTTSRIRIDGGTINAGNLTFNQTCFDVQFRGVNFIGANFILSVPQNPITLIDCIQDAQTTATGVATLLLSKNATDVGKISGITTDANPIAAWTQTVPPGEALLVSAKVIARRRDGITYGIFWPVGGATRPGATLPFVGALGGFTAGLVVTGRLSGASARITAVVQPGTTGTLTLRNLVGTFINGEVVGDTNVGLATFSGAIGFSNAALDGGTVALRAGVTTGSAWTAAFAVVGANMVLNVAGEAGAIVEWTVEVDVLEP